MSSPGVHRRERSRPERVAHDGRVLQDRALGGRERVEPRRDQPVDRLGQGDRRDVRDRSLVREHPDELERVQRVASGAGHERPLRLGREHRPHEQLREQALHVVLGERRQRHRRRVRLAGAPVAPDVEQLRSRRPHEQQRHVLEVFAELIEEVQHGRVRPVEILDHEHGRSLCRLGGQERRPRGERLLAVGRRRALGVDQAQQRREPGAQPVDVLRAERERTEMRLELGGRFLPVVGALHAGRLADHLFQRRERDRLAVGEAASAVPRRLRPLRSGRDRAGRRRGASSRCRVPRRS